MCLRTLSGAGSEGEFAGNIFRKPRAVTVRSGKETYSVDIIARGEGSYRVIHNSFSGTTRPVAFSEGKPGNVVLDNTVQDGRG